MVTNTAVRVRVTGDREHVGETVAAITRFLSVTRTSQPYPNRRDNEIRVYLTIQP